MRRTNPVYKDGVAEINRQLLSEWLQQEESAVPPLVSDCVVTVPVGDSGPGIVVQSGQPAPLRQRRACKTHS